MSTNDSAPDPTAGEPLRPRLLPVLDAGVGAGQITRDEALRVMDTLADAEHPATPPASEGLTEAEREVLFGAIDEAETCKCCGDDYGSKHVYIAVERIIAARVADAEAKARTDERERIAQAIDAEPPMSKAGYERRRALRIARGDA